MLDVSIPLEKNLTSQVPGITFFSAFKEAFLFKKEKKPTQIHCTNGTKDTKMYFIITTEEIPFPTLNES